MATAVRKKNNNHLNIFLNRYFNIFLSLALIVFLTFSYFVILRPKFNATLEALRTNIASQQKIQAQEEARLAGLRSMAELYKKIDSGDLNKFNKLLPDAYAPEQLFGELEEIFYKQGLVVDGITLGVDEASPDLPPSVGQVNIDLSLGKIDYRGLKNLLIMLENNSRLFDVTSLSFSPGGGAVSLKMATYYYKK